MNVREELGQISWFTKRYREPRRWVRQLRVIRHLDLPALPRQRRRPGEVWGGVGRPRRGGRDRGDRRATSSAKGWITSSSPTTARTMGRSNS